MDKQFSMIFIDADDTLYDFQRCEYNALINTFNSYQIESDDRLISTYKKINGALWKDLEKGLITQKEIKHERFRILAEKEGWNLDYMEVANKYTSYISNERVLMEGAKEICAYLAEKYTLILLTNGISEIQRGRFQNSILNQYFKKIVISDEACCSKPDPGIFEWSLKDMIAPPKNEMLIIGDSLSSDIQGGINYGITTCWMNIKGTPSDTIRADYEVQNLKDLKSIL